MWKYLFLLVILLDWGTGIYSGSNITPMTSDFNIEAPVTEVFELNHDGINIVDSVVNYMVGGAIHHQWIYYKDGSMTFFTSDFNIKDLNLRLKYIDFKKKNEGTVYNYTIPEKTVREIQTNFPSNFNQELVEEYMCFNAYLRSINELEIEGYITFINEIKGFKRAVIVPFEAHNRNKNKTLAGLSLFICLILLFISYRKSFYKRNITENTS